MCLTLKILFTDGSDSYMKVKGGELYENMEYDISVYAVTSDGDREGSIQMDIKTTISPSGGVCSSDVPGGECIKGMDPNRPVGWGE